MWRYKVSPAAAIQDNLLWSQKFLNDNNSKVSVAEKPESANIYFSERWLASNLPNLFYPILCWRENFQLSFKMFELIFTLSQSHKSSFPHFQISLESPVSDICHSLMSAAIHHWYFDLIFSSTGLHQLHQAEFSFISIFHIFIYLFFHIYFIVCPWYGHTLV